MQDQPVNYDAFRHGPKASQVWLWVGGCGALLFVMSFVIESQRTDIGFTHTEGPANPVTSAMFLGGAFMFGICFAIYGWLRSKAKKETFLAFLFQNNWQLEPVGAVDDVPATLLGVGHDQSISLAFSGNYRGLPLNGVEYRYVTGTGKSQETHVFMSFSFTLDKVFPLIVLDDKKNNFLFQSNLPKRVKGGKNLQLEGDFNERFALTVMPESEQTVLQLLTPDFMQELLQTSHRADIELAASRLYIIVPGQADDEMNIRSVFGMADVMLKNIAEVSDTWQASSSPSTINAIATSALTPRLGAQLRKRQLFGWSTLLIVLIYVVSWLVGAASR